MTVLHIDQRRASSAVDPKIYGQFIEHFGRLVYGGIFDPQSSLADEDGFRADVLSSLKKLNIPVLRWPGGCFASAYHWKDGIGPNREPVYDKAWCVEEPNLFGTHEFLRLCERLGAEPYLCGNAGSGTPEEMSDWVEYCNEPSLGRWAKLRAQNGHPAPWRVKFWSIGNENYTGGEIGAKRVGEWGHYVRETAKMIRRVDPTVQLLAAAVPDVDWNLALLREAGDLIDWISIHGYFDPAWEDGVLSGYARSLRAAAQFEQSILRVQGLLVALGLQHKIHVAFDEWNLRGWYHPGVADFSRLNPNHAEAAALRQKNEDNSQYTMADAVFCASFLNMCIRHSDCVRMANFSPTVCGRGLMGVNDHGIILRPAYHVFDLYRNRLGNLPVDSWLESCPSCDADGIFVPALDTVALLKEGALTVAVVNRDPLRSLPLQINTAVPASPRQMYTVNGPSTDSFNDFGANSVSVAETMITSGSLMLPPHSVSVITFSD